MLIRITQLNAHKTGNLVERYMCFLMLFLFGLVGERYRIRGKYREEFTSYFNAAIQLNSKHTNGKTQY